MAGPVLLTAVAGPVLSTAAVSEPMYKQVLRGHNHGIWSKQYLVLDEPIGCRLEP